ncbi:MAG: MBOAT family protein [Chloroflexi bacterium]|nr:MBOAT family protein [Chloroflexota bacterium]
MNFATPLYAVFLLVVVLAYWAMPRPWGRYLLVAASFVFYASWNALYVPGFMVLILANYVLGLLAAQPERRRLAVGLAVVVNIGLLALVKYLDWVLGSTAGLVEMVTGQPADWGVLGIVLPLAISFVTFTQLAYVIDIGRGAAPERHLGRYALFVSFFPHLIAGPIMRGHEFLPQVARPRSFSPRLLLIGGPLLVTGLFKKTLGDTLAPTADLAFTDPTDGRTLVLWIGLVAFAFQILLDFSGYTDMALGSAWLLGFRLPPNFDWPYRAQSIQEFWHRWHQTLSRWLRDYVYIPLGGNRKGRVRTYVNLFLTMVLGGLWHGAGLTFLLWGAWQGLGLVVNRWWTQARRARERPGLPTLLAWALTFGFVCLGWILFRSPDLATAMAYLKGMVLPQGALLRLGDSVQPITVVVIVLCVVGQWPGWVRLGRRLAPPLTSRRALAYGMAGATAIMLIPAQAVSFIYFQF